MAQITGVALIETLIQTAECWPGSNFNTDTRNQQADEFTEPSAGPVPTATEEAAVRRRPSGGFAVDEFHAHLLERPFQQAADVHL